MEPTEEELSLLKYEVPAFTWIRGRRCSVVYEPITSVQERWIKEGLSQPKTDDLPVRLANVSRNVVPHVFRAGDQDRLSSPVPQENRPSEVLFCEGEGEEYEPLKDAPQAYLEFVAVGRLGPATSERWRARDTASEKMLEATVSAWPDVQQAAVRFVEKHGLPRPGLLGLESYVGLPLIYFYEEAQDMAFIADILDAASLAEHDNDYDALGRMFASSNRLAPGLFKKKELGWLANAKIIAMLELNKHLHGVTLAPTVDLWHPIRTQAPPIRILPQYTCDSLLTAMWLQAYIAATERRIVRGHCKGCGRPFEARDKRQEYCDKYCRHATNQRDHYRRKKQLKRGGTI